MKQKTFYAIIGTDESFYAEEFENKAALKKAEEEANQIGVFFAKCTKKMAENHENFVSLKYKEKLKKNGDDW